MACMYLTLKPAKIKLDIKPINCIIILKVNYAYMLCTYSRM